MKKNTIFTKLVASFLSAILIFAMTPVSAFADDSISSNTTEEYVEVTEAMAVDIAESFAEAVGDIELTADDPIMFLDTSGEPAGYIIDLYDGETNHGYVILDNDNDSGFAMWSFDEGARSPLSVAIESTSSVASLDASTTEVYKTDSFEYIAVDTNTYDTVDSSGDLFSLSSDEFVELTDTDSNSSSSNLPVWATSACFIQNWWNNYDLTAYGYLQSFNAYPEWYVESITGTYACAVSALMVASDYYCSNFPTTPAPSLAVAYPAIWEQTLTTPSYASNGITYGSTQNGSIGWGFQNYAFYRGYNVGYTQTASPSYSNYVTCINRGDVAIFCAGLTNSAGRAGHAMAVQGYQTLTHKTTGAKIYTLVVADGWNDAGAYVNIGYAGFSDTYGIFFTG